eukprot:m.98509 g.98509  ORF g.98509 m.98509 type:complete len:128 (+) comp15280_c0_seq1:1195-1578(+)
MAAVRGSLVLGSGETTEFEAAFGGEGSKNTREQLTAVAAALRTVQENSNDTLTAAIKAAAAAGLSAEDELEPEMNLDEEEEDDENNGDKGADKDAVQPMDVSSDAPDTRDAAGPQRPTKKPRPADQA